MRGAVSALQLTRFTTLHGRDAKAHCMVPLWTVSFFPVSLEAVLKVMKEQTSCVNVNRD